ncbi:hypothetical protein JX265_010719 [Neoarthrinium moseri]|uniref:Carrier domain-containing protein n=1 Tax=Neoarthrinium moseri TaxID=1658444 RepID=A0A9P9WDZ4_9PEZI|nr:hypothetical protein JX265_010719 [Neoarthrinium moseri]
MAEMVDHIYRLEGKSSHASSLSQTYEPHILRGAWLLTLARYSAADVIQVKDIASAGSVELHTSADRPIHIFLEQVRKNMVGDACFTYGPVQTYPLAERCLKAGNINFMTAICHQTADLSQLVPCHIVLVIKDHGVNIFVDEALSSSKHDASLPKRIMGQFETVASKLQEAIPKSLIGNIDFMSPHDWEVAARDEIARPPRNRSTLHTMMLKNSSPGSQAIEAPDGSLTYAELDDASNIVARKLQQAGVARGSYVPLFFEKSRWHPVSVFACSKIGAPWVTIPIEMPSGRVQAIIDQLQDNGGRMSRVCLSSVRQRDLAASLIHTVIQVEEKLCSPTKANGIHTNHMVRGHNDSTSRAEEWGDVQPEDCAYVVFTSGTTGVPKGIAISQENICSFIPSWIKLRGHPGGPEIREGHILSYAWDVSVLEILVSLCTGSCLCILSEEERINDLGPSLARNGVTHLHITPSLSELLDPADLPALRHIHFAGEWTTQALVSRWLPRTEVLVTYGPAEITNECCGLRILHAAGFGNGCIGRPFGSRVYVVNPDNPHQRLPRGFVGEIIVEGPGVSAGYLGNPEATANTFVDNLTWAPAVDGQPRKFYRTGDLGYIDADGLFFCRGRKDSQVKIRGQRVELSEVEHHIKAFMPGGSSVVVDAATLRTGTTALTAFLQVDNSMLPASRYALVESLKSPLSAYLPPAFLPSSFLFVDRIPLGNTGKADRKKLRAMAEAAPMGLSATKLLEPNSAEPVALNASNDQTIITNGGLNDLEELLRELWALVLCLGADKITATSHFFGLGGDSVAAMKLVSMAKKKSISISSAQIFKTPTFQALVASIESTSQPPPTTQSTSPQNSHASKLAPFPARPLQAAGTQKSSNAISKSPTPLDSNANAYSGLQGSAGDGHNSLQISPMAKLEDTTTPALVVNGTGKSGPTKHSSDHEALLNGVLKDRRQGPETQKFNMNEIVASWAIEPECIEDVASATLIQQSSLTLSHLDNARNIMQWEFKLPSRTLHQRLLGAWQRVVDRNSVLRTRFFQSTAGLLQVVLADDFHWEVRRRVASAEARLHLRQKMAKTDGHLSDLVLFHAPGEDKQSLVWTVHRALVDEYAAKLIMNAVDKAYKGHVMPQLESFTSFSSMSASALITEAEKAYWETTLGRCHSVLFPTVSDLNLARVRATASLKRVVPGLCHATAALLRAAWALMVAKTTKTNDVVFGAVVNGRNDMRSMNVVGPLRNVVPVRLAVDPGVQVSDFIDQIHKDMATTKAFDQTPIAQLASISPMILRACQFQNILDIQILGSDTDDTGFEALSWAESVEQPFQKSAHALAIDCLVKPQGVHLVAQYDENIIKGEEVDQALAQFTDVLQRLASAPPGSTIQSILGKQSSVSHVDIAHIEECIRRWLPKDAECAVSSLVPPNSAPMLVAFISSDADVTDLAFASLTTQVRDRLEEELPVNMVPSAFYRMPSPTQHRNRPGTQANRTAPPTFPEWVLAQLPVDPAVIQDLTPATPFQTEIIGGMIQTPGAGTFLRRYPILPEMDYDRLSKAWDLVCAAMPCMRTRVIWSSKENSGCLVTLSTSTELEVGYYDSLPAAEAWINTLRVEAGTLGSALARAAVVHVAGHPPTFVYAMSHCVYDRDSLDVVWNALCDGYWSGLVPQTLLPYRYLMDHLGGIDLAPAREFWSGYLDGAPPTVFPTNPAPDYMTRPASSVSLAIPLLRSHGSVVTTATLVRAAWGLTIGSYTGSTDVVFRALLSGRTVDLDEIDRVCGPTLTNVPIRIRTTDQSLSVAEFLEKIQVDGADILEHETIGLGAIAELNAEAGHICRSFNNHLVVHPVEAPSKSRPLPLGQESIIMDMTGYVAFVLTCSLDTEQVVASTIHDPVVIDDVAAREVLVKFHGFLAALASAETKGGLTVGALISKQDQSR